MAIAKNVLAFPGAVAAAGLLTAVLLHAAEAPGERTAGAGGPATAPASRPATAALKGTIKSARPVTRLMAVDRGWTDVLKLSNDQFDEFTYPGKIDAKTGAFTVDGLLPGRTYDLIVFTDEGRWEGVTMDYHRPILPAEKFTPEDKQWISDFVSQTPQFYDKCRVLSLAADHKHATALVELMRTRDFHSGASGEVIYRVELWYFENLFGGWAKDKNTERVISRWRGPGGKIRQNWQYVPQLGGLAIDAAGQSPAVEVTLPEKADPRHGLAGGLKP